MAFHNVQFSTAYDYGTSGGPAFRTEVQTTASGHEYRIARQAQGRHTFDLQRSLMPEAEWAAAISFMLERRGALHGFRFKDWRDYSTGANGTGTPAGGDVTIGTGDGSETQFQLIKRYGIGGPNEYVRPITLPIVSTLVVQINGSPTSAYSISDPGGVLTFNSAVPDTQVVTAGFEFDVPVRFDLSDEQMDLLLTPGLLAQWQSIRLREILNEVETPELWYPGGSSDLITTSNDYTINFSNELWRFAPGAAISVFFPPPDRVPGGPRVFVLHNETGSAGSLQPRDDAGNAIGATVVAGATKRFALLRSGSSATWIQY